MFVDTNVLVAARLAAAPHHDIARSSLERIGASGEVVCISRQVIREYLAVVTRPQSWSDPLRMADALEDVRRLTAVFSVLEDGPEVMTILTALCSEIRVTGKQVHDANIVATMLAHRERRLLTFNIKDFHRYGERIELIGATAKSGRRSRRPRPSGPS